MGKGLLIGGFLALAGIGIGLYYWVTRDLKWEKVDKHEWESRPPGYLIVQTDDNRFELYHPRGRNRGFMGAFETFKIAEEEANKHHLGPR